LWGWGLLFPGKVGPHFGYLKISSDRGERSHSDSNFHLALGPEAVLTNWPKLNWLLWPVAELSDAFRRLRMHSSKDLSLLGS